MSEEMTKEQAERQRESARILGDWLAEHYPTSEPDIAAAALDTLKQLRVKVAERFWIGPARIVEMPHSPETRERYWEVYCETCRTHECMLSKGDPRLTERRDDHNRAHAERPLSWPGDPEHLRIRDLEQRLGANRG